MRPYYYMGNGWGLTQLSTGQPFFVNTNDRGITTWIVLGGVWETFVDDVICSYVSTGMTVLDIGANLGYYTVKLGSLIGETGRLHAFEPNPELNKFTAENISINGFYRHCTLHTVALGDKEGTAELGFDYANMGGGSLAAGSGVRGRTVDVQVRRLDDVLPNLPSVDFMKIDAEGYEPLILKGGRALIQRSPNCAYLLEVFLDAWSGHGSVPEQLAPLTSGKRLFAVNHSTQLIEMRPDDVPRYLRDVAGGMSYFFICPSDRSERVQRFIA
ncbi:FkbM family methyltransferase [Chelatococcus sp. GCM10030263]|uniref:FkbM family methyltransferase n=1 Tax=Chelatococcus sp. GCM10030263 TaxID=3273387 RepID=UPI0036227589